MATREGTALTQKQRTARRNCRHHWIIETPHGATSRGHCKRCGTTRRFPNAATDNIWDVMGSGMGRWASRRGAARPSEISLADKKKPSR